MQDFRSGNQDGNRDYRTIIFPYRPYIGRKILRLSHDRQSKQAFWETMQNEIKNPAKIRDFQAERVGFEFNTPYLIHSSTLKQNAKNTEFKPFFQSQLQLERRNQSLVNSIVPKSYHSIFFYRKIESAKKRPFHFFCICGKRGTLPTCQHPPYSADS